MPKPLSECAVAALAGENQLVVMGGFDGKTCHSAVYLCDLDTERWTTLQDMTTKRAGCSAVAMEKSILVMGGYDGTKYLDSVERLDLSEEDHSWKQIATITKARHGCAVDVFGKKEILVVGGKGDDNKHLSSVELFNPTTGKSKTLPPMSKKRYYCAMVVVEQKAYVFGGEGHRSAEVFDFDEQIWTDLPVMSTRRKGCAAVAIGSKCILVIGGETEGTVEMFNLSTQTWSLISSLNQTRKLTAAALVRNRLMVVGGVHAKAVLNTVENMIVGHEVPATPSYPSMPQSLGLGPRQLKVALEQWVDRVKVAKQEFQDNVEKTQAAWTVNYQKTKKKLEEPLKRLERNHEDRMSKLALAAQSWVGDVQDELEEAKQQISDLEDRIMGRPKIGQGKPPPELYCPLTNRLMVHPVVAADGHTYEKSAIQKIIDQTPPGKDVTSPITGASLPHSFLAPNYALTKLADKFVGKK